ncbi:MAG TPA: dockerin type I domain-containing protein, partial [Chthoniobacterales bacterium]
YTNNDGDLWLESTGAGIGQGIDHQTIGGGGPFHSPIPMGAAYPNAVYYCAQLPGSACALSFDGGQTFGPAIQTYQPGECGGLHGHLKVGPDGTAYLPNKACGIEQAVIVSEDNGFSWEVRRVPGSSSGGSDAAVAIGRGDKVPGYGKVYLGYADGDTRAVVTTSNDAGRSWSNPVNVGAAFGINNVAFPAMVAGDDDRAAIAFYGTATEGPLQDPKFTGVWHLYVATTYDGGATWHTVDATPNDPIQRGCIWLGGGANICRNMLDFFGIDLDKRGRVVVGWDDGCTGAECVQAAAKATGNSYTALGTITRQTGGKGLFAAHDALFSDASVAPGAPEVTALRNGNVVHLSWSTPNNGGSPITGFNISRGTASGAETFLIGVPGNLRQFSDAGATDPNATYFYKIQALNAFGSSCGNNEVQARYVGNSSVSPGYGVLFDPTEAGPQTANPDLDIRQLSIHEPTAGADAGKLVINLKVQSLALIPNERMWRVFWDSRFATGTPLAGGAPVHAGKFYVGMTKDAAGAISFEYGSVLVDDTAIAVGVPITQKAGEPDAASFTPDGLITIVISKDKVANPKTGDLLGDFEVRTYNTVSDVVRSNNAIDQATGNGADKTATANDLTANAATYMLVGPIPGVTDVVSRKTHGSAGTFDVSLLPGTPRIEPRRGAGTNNGDHQIVFRFAQPVTFTNATVFPPGPPGSGVSSTSPNNVPSTEVVVNLTGVGNQQTLTVRLNGVTLNGGTTNLEVPVSFLLGDTNTDRSVNSGDAQQTRNRSGQLTNGNNFLSDVNTDGSVNSGDAFIVRANSGKGL